MTFFANPKQPEMKELVYYIQYCFPYITEPMKDNGHNYSTKNINTYHVEDGIWTHTMMACLIADKNKVSKINKIAILLHDIGKPASIINMDEIEKRRFIGHEGISVFMSIRILKDLISKEVITEEEMIKILYIISYHGLLFQFIEDGKEKNEKKLLEYFRGLDIFEEYVAQVRSDSSGRFFLNGNYEKEHSDKLGVTIYGKDFIDRNKAIFEDKPIVNEDLPSITILIGPMCAGKSTWVKSNRTNEIIISRDLEIEKSYISKYGKATDYNTMFYDMTNDESAAIDKKLVTLYVKAIRAKESMIVDMTNISKKSRRRYLSQFKKNSYLRKGVVFLKDYEDIKECASTRKGKEVKPYILIDKMRGFMMPGYEEFDKIDYIIL
jgi:predicted kinase